MIIITITDTDMPMRTYVNSLVHGCVPGFEGLKMQSQVERKIKYHTLKI